MKTLSFYFPERYKIRKSKIDPLFATKFIESFIYIYMATVLQYKTPNSISMAAAPFIPELECFWFEH